MSISGCPLDEEGMSIAPLLLVWLRLFSLRLDHSRMLALTFCSMAPVVTAGEDGWSVIVVEVAPESADMIDGSAVPSACCQCLLLGML